MNLQTKTIIFWIVIVLSALLLWQVARQGNTQQQNIPEISYSEFLSQVSAGKVASLRIAKIKATGTYRDGRSFRVIVPSSQEQMLAALQQNGVEIWYSDNEETSPLAWLTNLLPLLLLAVLWFFMIRRMQVGTKALQERAAGNQTPPPPIG